MEELNILIIQKIGDRQYQIWREIQQQIKIRDNMIPKLRQKHIQNKANATITHNRSKHWHHTANQIGNMHQSSANTIDRIIYHQIATKETSNNLKQNINTNHFTTTKQQTVQLIGEYVNSIGSSLNPGYDPGIGTSRTAVRKLDAAWDYKSKLWATQYFKETLTQQQIQDSNKWRKDMEIMCQQWTKEELEAALAKCKNNVAYNGVIHILLLKNAPDQVHKIFLKIFNVWKNYGIITNGLNGRTLSPQPKPGKDARLIGNLRPIEWGIPMVYSNMCIIG